MSEEKQALIQNVKDAIELGDFSQVVIGIEKLLMYIDDKEDLWKLFA